MPSKPESAFDVLKGAYLAVEPHVKAHLDAVCEARGKESVRVTPLGSPCSRAWDDEWVAVVEAKEAELARRICGARSVSGGPCELSPDHANGRCRFHGGFDLSGGQRGNRNAVVHGLYARRLMVCGPQCGMWGSCPVACPEIEAMAPKDRPVCPFELAEYNAALTDGLAVADGRDMTSPLHQQTAHALALLQVMMSRAMATMSRNGLSPFSGEQGEQANNAMRALMRIFWEYRQLRGLFPPLGEDEAPSETSAVQQAMRMAVDTDLTPEGQGDLQFPANPRAVLRTGFINLDPGAALRGPRPDMQAVMPRWSKQRKVEAENVDEDEAEREEEEFDHE
ncbi:MAG: hypothetical protein AMXMBFR84_00420 [Candidatus Hydrogenedentota bacterium]